MLLFPPTPTLGGGSSVRGGHRPGQGGAARPGTWKEFLSPGWGAGGRRESVGEGGGPLSCRSQGCRGRARRGEGWEPLPWSARGRLVDPGARALEVGVGQQGPLPVLGLSPVGLGTAQSLLLGLLVRLKPRGQSLGVEPVWEVRGSASGPRGSRGGVGHIRAETHRKEGVQLSKMLYCCGRSQSLRGTGRRLPGHVEPPAEGLSPSQG